jgi:hypothetical protein
MPGPCSHPVGGKSRYVRQTKEKGATPAQGFPKNLAARIKEIPTNHGGKMNFNKPGSYKK